MKSYTDLEQSKKLAEFLPLESADCYYCYGMSVSTKKWSFDKTPTIIDERNQIDVEFDNPCWSLSALLDVIPSGKALIHDKGILGYKCICNNMDTYFYNNPVDACVEMVIKLHEQKLL